MWQEEIKGLIFLSQYGTLICPVQKTGVWQWHLNHFFDNTYTGCWGGGGGAETAGVSSSILVAPAEVTPGGHTGNFR